MFDIPFWLFTLFVSLSFGLTAITFARDPKAPIFMMVAGIMIFTMVALTDGIIFGYTDRLVSSVTNSTSGITQNSFERVPDIFPLTEWPKALFGLYGTSLIFIGSLIYKREK